MNKKIFSLLILFVCFNPSVANTTKLLYEIKVFSKSDLKRVKKIYSEFKNNPELFSDDQFKFISEKNLESIISNLILHHTIKFNDTETLIEFASEIKKSQIPFEQLERRLSRYIKKGELIFIALEQAIEKEQLHLWKVAENKKIHNSNNNFVSQIKKFELKKKDQDKLINAYAVCINIFNDKQARNKFMTPNICQPLDDYPRPNHMENNINIRTTSAGNRDKRYRAYKSLIAQARRITTKHNLNSFEKIMMSKCIAEQSLRFFYPSHKPLKAMVKSASIAYKTPANMFFMDTGVCTNFSAIAYNIAHKLGLEKVKLAQRGVHVYLEFKEQGEWYHAHPFNSKSDCDIIRF